MKLDVFVTKLALSVLMLVSINTAMASAYTTSANTQNKSATSTTAVPSAAVAATPDFQVAMKLSRSTNLNDFHDGTRNDSLDYEVNPTIKTSFGTFKTSITYSQNLRDKSSRTASDWGDIPLIYAFAPTSWKWAQRDAKVSY